MNGKGEGGWKTNGRLGTTTETEKGEGGGKGGGGGFGWNGGLKRYSGPR